MRSFTRIVTAFTLVSLLLDYSMGTDAGSVTVGGRLEAKHNVTTVGGSSKRHEAPASAPMTLDSGECTW